MNGNKTIYLLTTFKYFTMFNSQQAENEYKVNGRDTGETGYKYKNSIGVHIKRTTGNLYYLCICNVL